MKNLTPYLTSFCLVILFFNSRSTNAQNLGCSATEINKDLAIKNFQFIDDVNSLEKDNGTWSSSDGYKADGSCDHDCNVAPFDNAPPSASCSNGMYQIPIKIWIMTDDDGSNVAITTTQSSDQITYFNDYQACNNIPIELVEVASSPGYINSTDFNDFSNPSISGDSSDDGDVANAGFVTANAVNIYIPSTLNGGGCNGYAYLPGGPDRILMASNCYTSVADVCANTQSATVFIHEFGHYLGLSHTHGSYSPGSSGSGYSGTISAELVDGTNGCTTGDNIHDTPADLGISHALSANDPTDNPVGGCATRSSCTITFSCTDSNSATYVPQQDNIMNYNNLSGCRQEYSDCQKAKMVDALVCSRNYLCGKTVTDFFASSDVSLREKSICTGDAIPTFTAIDACKSWYNYSSGTRGSLIHTGSTFNPGTNAGLSNSTSGTFQYWVNDTNEFSPECGSLIVLTIEGSAADASPAVTSIVGNGSSNLSANGSTLASGSEIGWWITSNNPASTGISDQTTLDAAISGATIEGTITAPANNIFPSTSNGGQDVSIAIDCDNAANQSESFYATPYVVSASLAENNTSTAIPFSTLDVEGFVGSTPPYHPGVSVPVEVTGVPAGASLDKVCMFIEHPLISDLALKIVSPSGVVRFLAFNLPFNGSSPFSPNIGEAGNLACFVNIGEGGAAQSTCNGPRPPCLTGEIESKSNYSAFTGDQNGTWQILAYDRNNEAFAGTIESIRLEFDPPAPSFPSANYSDCLFGAPTLINCASLLPVELIDFQGEQNGKQIDLFWSTANEKNNDFFTIEKADQNGIFHEIAVVKGAGTTDENQYYNEIDFRPHAGQNLYRLKQTDFDGKTTTSAVIAIDFKAEETIDFFPNPVRGGAFTLQYQTEKNAGQAQLEIFALNGQSLHMQTLAVELGTNFYDVRVNDLAKGVYLARIINGNSVHTFKLTNVQ